MFNLPANISYDVFLLEEGTQLSLISQNFIQPQPTFTVTHDAQIFLSKTVSKISETTCQDITSSERMECVVDNIQTTILQTGISCLPFQFNNVFPKLYSKFSPCTNDSALAYKIVQVGCINILENSRLILINFQEIWVIIDMKMNSGCPNLCKNIEYHIRLSRMGRNIVASDDTKDRKIIYAKYNTPKIKTEEEYILMGANAIISATGGSLGLFLGLSCYGVVWKLVNVLEGTCHCNQSKKRVVSGDKVRLPV